MNPTEARAAAVKLIRAQLGLNDFPATWSYDQRVQYVKALSDYITAHAAQFTAQDLYTANSIQSAAVSPLADTSILSDVSAFGSAFADEAIAAGDQVAGVGRGVLSAASLAAWVIPGGLLILAAVWLYSTSKKVAA